MDFSNIDRLDHSILLGIVNEKLRLECESFDDLVTTYECDSQAVLDKLGHLGYQYDPLTNQFKADH
ncbi:MULTISPECIES: DUF4250 domain-containing protein [Vibrio]|uniref:DUF4250 domain-containing protein n=1 Tax=Vibrio ruber (strain DSM 16370 / JCM 11486 / BCRC 17186 / CECT 7878 / LMG 23124 / VR1) TaxID=1123498 RepID=A0A1R4LJE2_VIBR1|nr:MULTISPECIES: DUF4250 domain-containing protein [Vibrio]KUI99295.1 hypothetical protein VRK_13790 [Vibrio sp. MEBiC08052]SJN56635.1 hypothetical protein VR7878_01876 [Vibrio ruber DSM 16370]